MNDLIEPVDEKRGQSVKARRRWWALSSRHLYPLLTAIVFLCLWELVVRVADIGVWLLPRPSAVIAACFTKAPLLLPAALATTLEILEGFALSVVVGLGMAIAIVSNRTVEESVTKEGRAMSRRVGRASRLSVRCPRTSFS